MYLQDSAPCYKSWPGMSSDLIPVEHLWAICKKRIAKKDYNKNIIAVLFYDAEIKNICINPLN